MVNIAGDHRAVASGIPIRYEGHNRRPRSKRRSKYTNDGRHADTDETLQKAHKEERKQRKKKALPDQFPAFSYSQLLQLAKDHKVVLFRKSRANVAKALRDASKDNDVLNSKLFSFSSLDDKRTSAFSLSAALGLSQPPSQREAMDVSEDVAEPVSPPVLVTPKPDVSLDLNLQVEVLGR